MSKKAIIYCRFSPRPNADKSKSNEKQEERCRAYCARKGYIVVKVYCDSAISGKRLIRPGLSNTLSALQPGMVLVVDTNDRLARDMLVDLTIRAQIIHAECTLEFANGAPNDDTPEGRYVTNILAAGAQFERERYAARTKAGLARKKANGQRLGRPPIGWQRVKGEPQFLVNEIEQEAIHRVNELFGAKYTSKEIAIELTLVYGNFRGKPWSARTVRKIISNNEKVQK